MSLSKEIVEYVAKLSARRLTPEEIAKMQVDLGDTLELVAKLQSVDTDGVRPTSHVHGSVNAFRDDVTKPSLAVDDLKQMAPDFVSGGYRVPKII